VIFVAIEGRAAGILAVSGSASAWNQNYYADGG
jgi:hypothetical protein